MVVWVVLDEFIVLVEKVELLEQSCGCIEGLFGVNFVVFGVLGVEELLFVCIWLQFCGVQEVVYSVKEYIKGICEFELEERECYFKDMYCIFVGVESLFLKSLIQDICVDFCILDIGFFGIRGSVEVVVMVRSYI